MSRFRTKLKCVIKDKDMKKYYLGLFLNDNY